MDRRTLGRVALGAAATVVILNGAAGSAEILSYGYDAQGRLIGVGRQTGPADGHRDEIAIDAADNRSRFASFDVRVTIPSGQSITSADKRTMLAMQTDGNLVLLFNGAPLWSTQTNGKSAVRMVFQSDGNLVLYDANSGAVWQSHTSQNIGAKLALQNDGNLVIYSVVGVAIWQSNTGGHA